MKISDMAPATITLILVAVLLGVGLTILGTFGTTIRSDSHVVNEALRLWTHNLTPTANDYVDTDTAVGINFTVGGVIDMVWDREGKFLGSEVGLQDSAAMAG